MKRIDNVCDARAFSFFTLDFFGFPDWGIFLSESGAHAFPRGRINVFKDFFSLCQPWLRQMIFSDPKNARGQPLEQLCFIIAF